MADVIADRDIYLPQPGYPAARVKVARKGERIAERYLAEAEALAASRPAPVDEPAADAEPSYDDLKLAELKKLATDRGLEVDGRSKTDFITALEDADEADSAAGEDDDEPAADAE